MPNKQINTGVILKESNFNDKDKLLHIFTKEMGIILCVHKYGNTKKYANLLQIANEIEFAILNKTQSASVFKSIKCEGLSLSLLAGSNNFVMVKHLGVLSLSEILLSASVHTSAEDYQSYKTLALIINKQDFVKSYIHFTQGLISDYLLLQDELTSITLRASWDSFLKYLEAHGLSLSSFPATREFYKVLMS